MSKIVLWASNVSNQASFYSLLFDVGLPLADESFVEVSDGTNAVLLHALPSEFAAQISDDRALPAQDDVAIKPVFTVGSLDEARGRISGTLAVISPMSAHYGSFEYLDVTDPEGNIIQLQQKH